MRKGKHQKHKEPTNEMQKPLKDEDALHIVACWPDGMRRTMPEVTTSMYDATMNKHKPIKSSGPLWKATDPKTNSIISVKPRKDRGMLASLYDQGHQICQVRVEGFKTGLKEALPFMTAMGKEFMKGTIEKDDLSKKRDELLKNVDGYYERLKIANALLRQQKKKG